MPRTLAIVCALVLACASRVDAQQTLRVVAQNQGETRAKPSAVQARVGDDVVLSLELVDGARASPLPPDAVITWLRIEPRMQHVALLPPNENTPTYSNSVLFGPRHGDWLGFDTIEYEQHALVAVGDFTLEGQRLHVRGARTGEPTRDALGSAGSVWLAAEARLADGRTLRTPDARDVDRLGLTARVMRVSFREGDDFIGWLSTYQHVPDVFGSSGGRATTHQADRYVGADCMDLLTGAVRAMGRTDVTHASVSALAQLADPVSEVLVIGEDAIVRDVRGAPVLLAWGRDVQRGDLIALDYGNDPAQSLPRAWDHVGALVGDAADGARGVFDASDAYRNMTGLGVRDVALAREPAARAYLALEAADALGAQQSAAHLSCMCE